MDELESIRNMIKGLIPALRTLNEKYMTGQILKDLRNLEDLAGGFEVKPESAIKARECMSAFIQIGSMVRGFGHLDGNQPPDAYFNVPIPSTQVNAFNATIEMFHAVEREHKKAIEKTIASCFEMHTIAKTKKDLDDFVMKLPSMVVRMMLTATNLMCQIVKDEMEIRKVGN